jgi:hypothetical protein
MTAAQAAGLARVQGELQKRGALSTISLVGPEMRRFVQYAGRPLDFCRDILKVHLWSKQEEILQAIVEHRSVAVHSCHDSGKSFSMACLVAYWLSVYPPGESFVVTTAPTFQQVRAILWREINMLHGRCGLPGSVNQTEWRYGPLLVGMGRKPEDYSPDAFQGIHARRVLVVLDEACGVALPLWNAADTLVTNEESRIVAIGNPDDPAAQFFKVCDRDSGFHVIHIDGFQTPNFSGEDVPMEVKRLLLSDVWVEERRHRWGEGSPLWMSKVRGIFPETTENTLIPLPWLRAAQARWGEPMAESEPRCLGVDIGGGGDSTVLYQRVGSIATLLHEDTDHDTMHVVGLLEKYLYKTQSTHANVDVIGIGRGVVDRSKELSLPVIGVNVAERCEQDIDVKQFINKRARNFWTLRTRFEQGTVALDPDDDVLESELRAIRWGVLPNGKTFIESKEDMAARGVASPNHADAYMLAFADSVYDGPSPADLMPVELSGSLISDLAGLSGESPY